MTSQEPSAPQADVDEEEVFAPATPGAEALATEASDEDSEER
jgi:hypothetical protein